MSVKVNKKLLEQNYNLQIEFKLQLKRNNIVTKLDFNERIKQRQKILSNKQIIYIKNKENRYNFFKKIDNQTRDYFKVECIDYYNNTLEEI